MKIQTKLDSIYCQPVRAHYNDAGADLFANDSYMIDPGKTVAVDTGIAVKIPDGYVGLVFSKSGQGKKNIVLANGTGIIDSGYRGNIIVLVRNEGEEPYYIEKHKTKVAQLVVMPVILPEFVTPKGAWDDSERGNNGFGSTG